MKKIISLMGAGAMLLSIAAPALARSTCHRCSDRRDRCCPVLVNDNDVRTYADVDVRANTGDNKIEVEKATVGRRGDLEIETGDAFADGFVVVGNENRVTAGRRTAPVLNENNVRTYADVDVRANTGDNRIEVERAYVGGELEIETGNATAYGSVEVTNANYVRVR